MESKDDRILQGKTAIVTGGGYGIGKAIAFDYARAGANVVTCDIEKEYIKQLESECTSTNLTIIALRADITNEADVHSVVTETLKQFKQIDILVNNAGINGPMDPITELQKKDWDAVMDANLTGMFLFSKAVLTQMVKQKTGNIINLSSGAGLKGAPVRRLAYVVSKFGVEGLTYALSEQMAPYGICVNAMRPAPTDTLMAKGLPPERKVKLRKPEEMSKLALYLAQQTVETMTGQSIAFQDWEKGERE